MARRENNNNLILLRDNLSDSILGLHYRVPTTKERQSYINKRSVRQGNKYVDNSAGCRVEFGGRILAGLREGDFERTMPDGTYRPISTNKDSADYFEGWKEWMTEHCADVLTALAVRVFEMPVTAGAEEDNSGTGAEEALEKE